VGQRREVRRFFNSVALGILVPVVCVWIGVAWCQRITIHVTNTGTVPVTEFVLYGLDGEGDQVTWKVERLEPGSTVTAWYRRAYSVDVGSVHFSREGRRFVATAKTTASVPEGVELGIEMGTNSVNGTLRSTSPETDGVQFGLLDVTPSAPTQGR